MLIMIVIAWVGALGRCKTREMYHPGGQGANKVFSDIMFASYHIQSRPSFGFYRLPLMPTYHSHTHTHTHTHTAMLKARTPMRVRRSWDSSFPWRSMLLTATHWG